MLIPNQSTFTARCQKSTFKLNHMALCNALHFAFEFEQEVLYNSILDKEREDNVIMEMLNLILRVILSIFFQPVI